MRLLPITLAATLCAIGSVPAEQETTEKIDLEARKRSIPILEEHLKDREERLAEIAADIIRLNDRLEGKVDKIVKKLAGIKDSQKSGYRVSQIKMDAIDGLKRSIEKYQTRRIALIREVREQRTGIPKEVLEGDAAKFDKRIEKRVDQILELSKSFTQDGDVEKYRKVAGGGYSYNGWDDELYEISDEWRQNRRDRTMDGKQRKEIMDALKKAIERHESLIASLKDNLANRKMSKTDRDLMSSELKRHEQILAVRENQHHEMFEIDSPNTSQVSRDAAQDLEEALADASGDLRRDFETIFVKYAELNKERQKVFKVKRNLEARKKWITDYVKKCEEDGVKP